MQVPRENGAALLQVLPTVVEGKGFADKRASNVINRREVPCTTYAQNRLEAMRCELQGMQEKCHREFGS